MLGGKIIAVMPIDLARDEIVLIRQFPPRRPTGERQRRHDRRSWPGGSRAGEQLAAAARRECREEIGVAPTALVELFSFLTTPGVTDEEVTVFLAAVDASQVPPRIANAAEGERIETLRVSIDTALAALSGNRLRFGPMLIALQWLALNRARVTELLQG